MLLKFLFIFNLIFIPALVNGQQNELAGQSEKEQTLRLGLQKCLHLALENSHQSKISAEALKIAQAQQQQVMASYWPQINASASFIRLDENPQFVYPEETSNYVISGLLAQPMEVSVTVPEKHTILMNRDLGTMNLDFTYPLYLGGKRKALQRQVQGQIDLVQSEKKRTDQQIILDVKTRYYGNVLAKKLYDLGSETLERVDVTLELTEQLYKNGSGSVKKTDYLKNKIFASSMRGLMATLKQNLELSAEALSFTVAEPNGALIAPTDTELPFTELNLNNGMVRSQAFTSNPDWAKLGQAVKIFDAKIDEAKSEYMFNVALIGRLNHIENSYNAGAVSQPDKNSWMVGFGVQIPLFSGFSTKYKVQEMQAHLAQLEQQKDYFKDGLVLKIKVDIVKINNLQQKIAASKEAMETAIENRDLTERAYGIEMATAQDMIQSQLFESLMIAQYYKSLYDHILAKAHLDYLVGMEVQKTVE